MIQILSESVDSSGIFEAKVNGLEPGKKYFYKAFGQTRGDDPTGGSTIVKESYGAYFPSVHHKQIIHQTGQTHSPHRLGIGGPVHGLVPFT